MTTAAVVVDETRHDHPAPAPPRRPRRIPLSRLVGVELRKMFDTRSGFWLMASIVIVNLLATGAVVLRPGARTSPTRPSPAIGFPMTVILPMIGILAVTSEWSQRSGLTTFTLVPHRGRVLWAKFLCAVGVGVVAMFVALVIGALGNVVGTAVAGIDPVWNVTVSQFALIVLGSVLGMVFGFMLGVLVRNSAGAIVAYFVYSFVLPPSPACSRRTSSGSPTCSRGSTSASPSTRSSTAWSPVSSGPSSPCRAP